MNPSDISIVATGPSGFPGASQIMCQYLRELTTLGCDVHYVGFRKPVPFQVSDCPRVAFHLFRPLSAGAIGASRAVESSDVLFSEQISECMIGVVDNIPYNRPLLLWGTYLFPYGRAAIDVRRAGAPRGAPVRLWLTPSGSDVWELGRSLVRLTGALLRDPNVDCILTYTGRFANEIQASFGKGVELPIRSLYPIVDLARFHPLDKEGRTRARAELGISDETFVITSHSNMRPVKAPEDVLNIAHAVSEAVAREVLLLLIGPSLAMEALPPSSKLRIRQMGVLDRVEGILQISDLELNCSYHDSFNLSLGEAMACGVPCATTDVVGIADELRGSGGGVLFALEPPEEVPRGRRYEAVVSDIAYLANNEPLRRKLATAAHERASATFSRRRVLPALAALMTDTFRNSESAQGGEGDQSSLPATGGS